MCDVGAWDGYSTIKSSKVSQFNWWANIITTIGMKRGRAFNTLDYEIH